MAFEGLDDRKYHFLEVRIQEIRLLLEIVYLRVEGTVSLRIENTYAVAHCQLHVMYSHPLRSGVLIGWIVVQVERKKGAEILEKPFALLEFRGYRTFCDLGTLLGVHNPTVS